MLDKSILNNAILMEYNVETGVVLSIFYGDTEAFEDGREFVYDATLADTDDKIYTITGNRGYEFAEQRKQGYYGANGTGDLLPPPDMMPQTEIFDGAFKPTPDGQINVLYVEAYLPTGADLANYDLSLVPPTGPDIPVGNLADLGDLLNHRVSDEPVDLDQRIFQYGIDVSHLFEKRIILLDHVNGTTTDDLRIEELGITTPQTVQARITDKTRGTPGEASTTFANTLFFGDLNGGFEVTSARHLFNIRHVLDGNYFQTQDIDMHPTYPDEDDPDLMLLDTTNHIENFTPIGTAAEPFIGIYDAYSTSTDDEDNTGITPRTISDLTITFDSDNIGLFGVIQPSAPATDTTPAVGGLVQYLNLDNVEISGRQNVGAVAGQSSTDSTIVVVSVSGTVNGTADNTGGLVGQNNGTIAMSSSSAAVTGVNDVGGLVGDNSGTLVTPTVTNITVTGSGEKVGGVAGFTSAPIQNAVVRDCTVQGVVTGVVTAEGTYDTSTVTKVGGVVGEAQAAITNATVTGSDTTAIGGGSQIGGVAGLTNSEITTAAVTDVTVTAYTSLAGGVAGQAVGTNAKISGATITGATVQALRAGEQGGDSVGGVAGWTEAAITDSNVFDTIVSAQGNSAGGVAGRAEHVDAVISEVTVNGATIRAGRFAAGGVAGETLADITKAEVSGTTVTGDSLGGYPSDYIGGIAGRTTANIGTATEKTGIQVTDVSVYSVSGISGGVLGGIYDNVHGRRMGAVGATSIDVNIRGVKLEGVTVAGYTDGTETKNPSDIGGVVGRLSPQPYAGDGANYPAFDRATASISGVSATNVTVTSGGNRVGGVAGEFAPASGGSITGVTLDGTNTITGREQVGGILGRTRYDLDTTFPDSTITIGGAGNDRSVTVSGTTAVTGEKHVGGAIGLFAPNGTGSITNVHVINAMVNGGGYNITGGILGGTTENAGNITNANVITITGVSVSGAKIRGASQVGGIAGEFAHVNTRAAIGDDTVDGIKVTGTEITGTGESIGGVAGETSLRATVTNAVVENRTAVQNLEGGTDPHGNAVGGVVGRNGGTIATVTVIDSDVWGRYMVGGVAGLSFNAITAANVTNTNVASRRSSAGGVVGEVGGPGGTVSNSAVTGGATGGNVRGDGNFIGGAVGKTRANISNITVRGVSVSSEGGGSVGGVVGGNELPAAPAVTDVLAMDTRVYGYKDNVGGIAGISDGLTLRNAVYLSTASGEQIWGAEENKASIGGIVGHNLGKISDVLFLALAPKVGDAITPITNEIENVTNAYYLKGQPIRPNPVADTRSGYNLEELSGDKVGAGHSTWALYSKFVPDGNGAVTLNADWDKNSGFTAPDHVYAMSNETYPYPYIKGLTTPSHPGWPIAKDDVIMGPVIQYFEWTGDKNFYVWNGGDRPNDGMPNDSETLRQAGYAFIFSENLTDIDLFVRPAGSDDTVEWKEAGSFETTDRALAAAMGNGDYYAHLLPLKELAAVVGNSDTPLELMYKNSEDATVLLSSYIHPLFAKAVYDRNATDYDTLHPPKFYIRTAWQMQNIGKLTTGTEEGPTKGKTFIQDRSFKVAISNQSNSTQWMGVEADAEPSGIANDTLVDGGNADDHFSGTFIGAGFEITDLPFGKGLFATIAQDIGKVTGVTVKGHESPASGNLIGTVAMKNEGVIEKCLVEGSVFDLGVQAANVGFIVGENAGTITGCLVRGSSITNGSSSVGGVAGLNSTMIQNSGVIESTIAGNANSIGGIVGTNSGTVQDVFFLSTVTPKEIADGTKAPPVSNNGGGIVGENVAYVKRAMYLAVAPKSTTHIYPIMRVGSATDSGPDASFYLYGGKYRVMPGANGATVDWVSGSYNLEPIGGGGKKLDTEGLDLANLEQSDPRIPMQPYGWASTASGEIRYPYPVFDAANPPASWPETEGVGRPKQAVGDWQDAWVQPMKKMNFLNGEFDRPYVSGKPNNAGLPTSGTVGQVNGVWHGNDVNVYMTHVEGWSARPTNPADYKPDNAQYLIELANPRNDFMPRDYKGNPQKGDLTKAPSESTYAELNAAKVGTLYQVADTEPGQEFYYSFHHASRLWPMDATSTTDTMNFYLSPTGSRIDPVYNNIADEDKLQLIRPVASPHESSLPEMEIDFYPYANNGGPTGMIQSVDRDGDRRTAEELSDDLPNTSWKAFSMNTPLSFFRMGGHHFKVVRYEMTRQKSDAPMLGDPNEWELQGTTDGVNWTTVDRRGVGSNDYTVTLTSETTTFIVQNPGMYWEYRFVFKNAYYLEQTTMTGMPQYPAFSELKVYMPDARALEAFGRVITFPQDALGGTPHTQNPGGYNYGAWQTVKYGPDKTAGMKTYWKAYFPNFPDSDVYLYDVWIGDLDSDKGGYGLTFWSKQNFDVVKNEARGSIWWYGYNTIDQFEERLGSSDVVNNVIGYWDVDNGWKQYYGRYIVPPGQTQTEFAYQATTKTPGIGNFLDAAMFKPAAVLSVSEVMYKPGDTTKTPVTLADPGDHLTLEMTITANGDQDVLEARNVTLTNEFGDFSQYFKYDGEVRINDVPPSAMAYRHTIDSKGNSVFTANNLTVPPGQSVVVSFEIEILKNIYGNAADYSTLFYFIQNQAKVEYTSFKVDEQLGRTMTTYSPVNQTVNISQIPMNKTITEVDAAGNVLAAAGKNPVGKTDSIFQVELTLNGRIPVTGLVSDTLPKGFALVEDSITKLDGTPLEEGDAEDYILYGEGTDYPRLVFLNVDFVNGVDKQHGFCYQMTYVGDQFGVTNAGVEAYYRFRYESTGANGVVNADIISLPFTEPKLGIRATAPNEHFIVPDEGGIIPNLVEHSNINRADLPYVGVSFLPEIVFYEADGTTLLPVTESEGHPVISTADYTAKLMNDNSLNFAPASGSTSGATIPAGDYILYYKIAADDTANSGFDLSSESVGTITITVDATATAVSSVQAAQPAPPAPAPDAPNPAPPAVLPPVAAATLGLLSAALGGEAGASVSGKNGVSAAVATMLGALSLLLVLTGLVLLPEKKRRPKR